MFVDVACLTSVMYRVIYICCTYISGKDHTFVKYNDQTGEFYRFCAYLQRPDW